MKKYLNKIKFALFVIFIVSVLIRTVNLGEVPLGLHADEVANAYGTKYILKNGFDIYKNSPPLLYLDKFGDYPPVIPMYFSGLGALIFGNTEFGARIFIALFGALAIFPVYEIALFIFKNKKTALFTALILAVSPWHVSLSRLSAEGIVALTVFLFGCSLLFKALESNKSVSLIVAFLVLLSTYFLYPSFRIIVPLFLIPIAFFRRDNKILNRKNILYLLLIILAFVLTIYISRQPWGSGRFDQTSIISPLSGVSIKLQTLIFNEDSIFIARIFNNKLIGYLREFLFQYSRYFSFNFLFGEDGIPPIYVTPYVGLIYVSLLPFIFSAIIGAIQNINKAIKNKFFIYLIYLLLISPIPAAMTVLDVPSIHRAILTPVLIIFLAGYGFNGLLQVKFKKIPVVLPICILLFGEFVFFTHNYFQHISYYTTHHRNPGNKQVVEFINKNYTKYDAFYITNEELWLPTYYLYFSDIFDPSLAGKFQKNFRMTNIGKVFFKEDSCAPLTTINQSLFKNKLSVPKKSIFIYKESCKPYENLHAGVFFKPINTIKALDEIVIYHIDEINPNFSNNELKSLSDFIDKKDSK